MGRFVLFGGKGGVGKTTCAAAAGLALARQGSDALVISTDPAHSLGDAFDVDLGGAPTAVDDSLWAAQTDPEAGTAAYRRLFEDVTDELADAGIDLEEAALRELFSSGGLPGGDELAALDAVARYADDEHFDVVVVDTAPTGHTLRLLDLPETVGTGVRTALSLRDQVRRKTDAARTMVFGPYAAIGRRREDEDETASFAALADKMDRVATVLRDPERTRFHVVTTPEVLAVRETDRLLDQLREAEIPVGTIVVNRVLEDIDDDCERCTSRQARQREIVTDLRATHPDLDLVTLPDRVSDLQGVVELAPLADRLAEAGFAD